MKKQKPQKAQKGRGPFVPFVAILPLISYHPNETYHMVVVRRVGVLCCGIRSAAAGNGTVILSCSVRSVLRCLP
jgi:hypothetical protein